MLELESLEGAYSAIAEYADNVSPFLDWIRGNWMLLVLSGEIVGAVLAIKMGRYRRGIVWLAAALATIRIGAFR